MTETTAAEKTRAAVKLKKDVFDQIHWQANKTAEEARGSLRYAEHQRMQNHAQSSIRHLSSDMQLPAMSVIHDITEAYDDTPNTRNIRAIWERKNRKTGIWETHISQVKKFAGTDPNDAHFYKHDSPVTDLPTSFRKEQSDPFPLAYATFQQPTDKMVEISNEIWGTILYTTQVDIRKDGRDALVSLINPTKLKNIRTLGVHDGQLARVDVGFCQPDFLLTGIPDASTRVLIELVQVIIPHCKRLQRIIWFTGFGDYLTLCDCNFIQRNVCVEKETQLQNTVKQNIYNFTQSIANNDNLRKLTNIWVLPFETNSINDRTDPALVQYIIMIYDEVRNNPTTKFRAIAITEGMMFESDNAHLMPWCAPLAVMLVEDDLQVKIVFDRHSVISFFQTYEQTLISHVYPPGIDEGKPDANRMAETNQVFDIEAERINVGDNLTMPISNNLRSGAMTDSGLLNNPHERAQKTFETLCKLPSVPQMTINPVYLKIKNRNNGNYVWGSCHTFDVVMMYFKKTFQELTPFSFWKGCTTFLSQLNEPANPVGLTNRQLYGEEITNWQDSDTALNNQATWKHHATMRWFVALIMALGVDNCKNGLEQILQTPKEIVEDPETMYTLVYVSGSPKILNLFSKTPDEAAKLYQRYCVRVQHRILNCIILDDFCNKGRQTIITICSNLGLHFQHFIRGGEGDVSLFALFGVCGLMIPTESHSVTALNTQVFHIGCFANDYAYLPDDQFQHKVSQFRIQIPERNEGHPEGTDLHDEAVEMIQDPFESPSVLQMDLGYQRMHIPEFYDEANQTHLQAQDARLTRLYHREQHAGLGNSARYASGTELARQDVHDPTRPIITEEDTPGTELQTPMQILYLGKGDTPNYQLVTVDRLEQLQIPTSQSKCHFALNQRFCVKFTNPLIPLLSVAPTGIFIDIVERLNSTEPFLSRKIAPPTTPVHFPKTRTSETTMSTLASPIHTGGTRKDIATKLPITPASSDGHLSKEIQTEFTPKLSTRTITVETTKHSLVNESESAFSAPMNKNPTPKKPRSDTSSEDRKKRQRGPRGKDKSHSRPTSIDRAPLGPAGSQFQNPIHIADDTPSTLPAPPIMRKSSLSPILPFLADTHNASVSPTKGQPQNFSTVCGARCEPSKQCLRNHSGGHECSNPRRDFSRQNQQADKDGHPRGNDERAQFSGTTGPAAKH